MPHKPKTHNPSFRSGKASPQKLTHRYSEDRPSAAKRGYGRKWRKLRLIYLTENPLCVECRKKGLVRAASVVDHITPHKGDDSLFWDQDNWQSMCKRCHAVKTAKGK